MNNTSQNPQRTLLSILRADENLIAQRKQNIRRFGAGWLRPPGVAKTLQGMDDEKAEREEVESARARYVLLIPTTAHSSPIASHHLTRTTHQRIRSRRSATSRRSAKSRHPRTRRRRRTDPGPRRLSTRSRRRRLERCRHDRRRGGRRRRWLGSYRT